jgi:hypothetical protein
MQSLGGGGSARTSKRSARRRRRAATAISVGCLAGFAFITGDFYNARKRRMWDKGKRRRKEKRGSEEKERKRASVRAAGGARVRPQTSDDTRAKSR